MNYRPVKFYFPASLLVLFFSCPFLIKDGDFKVDMSQWKFLILRNLAGIASMLLTFYAIKYLPISIAILLMNTSALFVPLLLFFFKVKTPLKGIGLQLYGVLLVYPSLC